MYFFCKYNLLVSNELLTDEVAAVRTVIVDKLLPLKSGFSTPPTRDGLTVNFSVLNVLHSDPTSIARSITTKPHSGQIRSPAR